MTQIGKWVARLVLGLIAAIDVYLVERIKSELAKRGIRSLLTPLKQITTALGDDNPRNEEQVEGILKKYLNQDVPVFATGEISAALKKVGDDDTRIVLQTVSEPVVEMLRLVSDDDPNNGEQLKELVKQFVQSEATQRVFILHALIPLIEAKVNGPMKEVLLQVIHDVLLGDGDGLA